MFLLPLRLVITSAQQNKLVYTDAGTEQESEIGCQPRMKEKYDLHYVSYLDDLVFLYLRL